MDQNTPDHRRQRGRSSVSRTSQEDDQPLTKRQRVSPGGDEHLTELRTATNKGTTKATQPSLKELRFTVESSAKIIVVLRGSKGQVLGQDSLDSFIQDGLELNPDRQLLSMYDWSKFECWVRKFTTKYGITDKRIYIGPAIPTRLEPQDLRLIEDGGALRAQLARYLQQGDLEQDSEGFQVITFYIATDSNEQAQSAPPAKDSSTAISSSPLDSSHDMDVDILNDITDIEMHTPSKPPPVNEAEGIKVESPNRVPLDEDAESFVLDLTQDDNPPSNARIAAPPVVPNDVIMFNQHDRPFDTTIYDQQTTSSSASISVNTVHNSQIQNQTKQAMDRHRGRLEDDSDDTFAGISVSSEAMTFPTTMPDGHVILNQHDLSSPVSPQAHQTNNNEGSESSDSRSNDTVKILTSRLRALRDESDASDDGFDNVDGDDIEHNYDDIPHLDDQTVLPATVPVKVVRALGNNDALVISDSSDDDRSDTTDDTDALSKKNGDPTNVVEDIRGIGKTCGNRDISTEDWAQICRFFQCSPTVRAYKPPGFKMELAGYQMHSIWWMLTQWSHRDIPGGILGDQMGLGKTVQALSVFGIFAAIMTRWPAVTTGQKDPTSADARNHLPHPEEQRGEPCPTQHTMPFGVQCPCVSGSDTRRIAMTLEPYPTLCLVPPDTIGGWYREYKQLFDNTYPFVRSLHIKINRHEFNKTTVALSPEAVKRSICITESDGKCYLVEKPRLAKWLILSSYHTAGSLRKQYQVPMQLEGKLSKEDGLLATFVFFDEAHDFWGKYQCPTKPYQTITALQQDAGIPMLLFCITASIVTDGPKNLHNVVGYLNRVRQSMQKKDNIGKLSDNSIRELEKAWIWLVSNAHRKETSQRVKTTMTEHTTTIKKDLKVLYEAILMARSFNDLFRGEKLRTTNIVSNEETIYCDMKGGEAHQAFKELAREVHKAVQHALDKEIKQWSDAGKVGDEPSMEVVMRKVFGYENKKSANLSGDAERAWNILDRSNSYPALAKLVSEKELEYIEILSKKVQPYCLDAGRIAASTGKETEDKTQELGSIFSNMSFWRYRKPLLESSQKYTALKKIVLEMIVHRKQPATGVDPDKDSIDVDDDDIRHMIVFVRNPVSVLVTLMFLSRDFPDAWIVPLASSTPISARGKSDFGRDKILQRLSDRCGPQSRNKIIITTYDVGGESANMQRANYCVLMEPASSVSAMKQAIGRVERIGQRLQVEVRHLVDRRNLLESLLQTRQENEKQLLGRHQESFAWKDFIM